MTFPGCIKVSSLFVSCLITVGLLSSCGEGGSKQPREPSVPQASDEVSVADPNAMLLDGSDGANWPAFGRTYGEQHHSPLTEINDKTIDRLGLAWYRDLGPGNPVSAPLAVDGVLYTATGYSIIRAIDGATGELLWTYDPNVPEAAGKRLRQGWGARGLAYWNGKIYTGAQDGRLIALDAETGEKLWSAMTLQEGGDERAVTGPPRVFDGKVIIGHGGADRGPIRAYVTTYDAETGEQLWRFYTVPGNPADGFESEAMAMAAETWHGEWWKHGGGGTAWNAMTYDAEQDLIIIGTGNGYPWNHRIRSEGKGDNLFLASVVALDADSGEYRWHYQTNPGETWDYNTVMDMQLAELEIDGEHRKVLMTAPKNGFFYVIDRSNGELISAEPIAKVTWASHINLETGRPVENPDARFPDGSTFDLWPSFMGSHNWYPMAYNPETRLAYIPVTELGASYTDAGITPESYEDLEGRVRDLAVKPSFKLKDPDPINGTSALLAWDPKTQEEAWRVPTPGPFNGGVMATAGNLVFQGRIDREFNAYAADTGEKLWSFPAQAAVLAPPITYKAGGKQYITVLTGIGVSTSMFGDLLPVKIDYRTEAKRILTFALDGDVKLPKSTPAEKRPVNDPDFEHDSESYKRGAVAYSNYCANCHGFGAVATGQAPDLRTSAIPLEFEPFAEVVREGALLSRGMPRFAELTDRELNDLRQYIRAETDKLRNPDSYPEDPGFVGGH